MGAAMVVAGCATLSVSSHIEPGVDLAQYHTFDWGPADALPTSDARLNEDPAFNDWVQGAVERGLARKGIALTESEAEPDLRIHYHANITERIDVDRLDQDYGFCTGEGCLPPVRTYEAGTLVIDIIDARTNRVIWRGWAQDSIKDELDDPDRMEATVEEAVARMLTRFPRSM
jgi:hypothetical protein